MARRWGPAGDPVHQGATRADRPVTRLHAATGIDVPTNGLVVKGDPASSPFIQVPSTGMATSGAIHVTTLNGSKKESWTTWITNQAPF